MAYDWHVLSLSYTNHLILRNFHYQKHPSEVKYQSFKKANSSIKVFTTHSLCQLLVPLFLSCEECHNTELKLQRIFYSLIVWGSTMKINRI